MESPDHVEQWRHAPAIDPVAEEERKARMRVHARRSYYRKLNRVQELRGQVEQLEAQYGELLHQVRLQEASAFVVAAEEENWSSAIENESLTSMYADLMDMKKQLRQENDALKEALDQHQMYQRFIRLAMSDISGDPSSEAEHSDSSTSTSTGYHSQRDPLIVIPSFRKPVTLAFCHELGKQTFADVTQFHQNPDFMTTGASIFGYRDRSVLQDKSLQFLLMKTFRHISADELAARSWDFFSQAKNQEKICSASMNPRVFQIQRVDERNRVLLRIFSMRGGYVQVKFLFLVSFLEIPKGHMIVMRAIKHELLNPYDNAPRVVEQWMDNYYGWITYERAQDDDECCEMNYGGILPLTAGTRSTALMMETLSMTLRSEGHILGLNLVTAS